MSDKLTSRLNNILFKISSEDKFSFSPYEIDSQKEVTKLGSYLNGQIDNYTMESDGLTPFEALDIEEKKELESLYESLKNKFLPKTENEMSITDIEKNAQNIYYGKKVKNKDYNTIVKSINLNNISDIDSNVLEELCVSSLLNKGLKEKNYYNGIQHIKNTLITKAKELNINENTINKALSYEEKGIEVCIRNLANTIQTKENELAEIAEQEKLKNKKYSKNDKRNNLQKATEDYFVKNGLVLTEIEYPRRGYIRNQFGEGPSQTNGDIKPGKTTQTIGNCWLMAAINSLAITEEGKQLLKKHIYRDQAHGSTAIYFGEAEKKELGYQGTGVYVIPDGQVRAVEHSDGDLDIAVYNKATEKYFNDIGENNFINKILKEKGFDISNLDGNTTSRFYEVLTGKESEQSEILYANKEKIINTKNPKFEDIINTHKDKAAITLGINLNELFKKDGIAMHAFSVVGVDNQGNIVLQESNNSEYIANGFKNSYKDENGTINIKVTKEEFQRLKDVNASAIVP